MSKNNYCCDVVPPKSIADCSNKNPRTNDTYYVCSECGEVYPFKPDECILCSFYKQKTKQINALDFTSCIALDK
jgi:hypothetical protein